MRFLLDTHSLIWFLTNYNRLPKYIKSQIKDGANQSLVSIASLWEIEIGLENLFEKVNSSAIEIKPILPDEILLLSQLPFYHRDPFDRILIAKAQSNDLPIITKDNPFRKDPVTTLWD